MNAKKYNDETLVTQKIIDLINKLEKYIVNLEFQED